MWVVPFQLSRGRFLGQGAEELRERGQRRGRRVLRRTEVLVCLDSGSDHLKVEDEIVTFETDEGESGRYAWIGRPSELT